MVVPPGEVLDAARAAAKQGDYAVALEKYERFFDRALLDQGEDNNYYGVRLFLLPQRVGTPWEQVLPCKEAP
jgi:hypothetical protein